MRKPVAYECERTEEYEYASITPYINKEDYEVVYDFGKECNRALIYKKSTNCVVEEYVEDIQEETGKTRGYVGYRNISLTGYFYPSDANHPSTQMRTIANVRVYSETISSQTVNTIISVNSTETQLVSDGVYTLESCMTTVNNYTSSRVDVDCIGVLATTSVLAMAADLGGSLLETVGFSIEFSTSTAWTARMAFSRSVRISV